MPWDRSQPTAAKYRTAEHRHTRARLMAELRRDGAGCCAEPVCVMSSRLITADMDLHLCHTTDGTALRGLGHARCNLKAAAREARRRQLHGRQQLSPIW